MLSLANFFEGYMFVIFGGANYFQSYKQQLPNYIQTIYVASRVIFICSLKQNPRVHVYDYHTLISSTVLEILYYLTLRDESRVKPQARVSPNIFVGYLYQNYPSHLVKMHIA